MSWLLHHLGLLIAVLLPLVHLAGLGHAVHAVMHVRTAQGAVAWVISLITFPYVAMPLYWIFGRARFSGYEELLHTAREANAQLVKKIQDALSPFAVVDGSPGEECEAGLEALSEFGFTRGNAVTLLVDGEKTFAAIFDSIRAAQHYVLIEFYIIHDDTLGTELAQLLCEKSREGVKIRVIYDEVGSHKLSTTYKQTLMAAGVEIRPFQTTQGKLNRFQLNFRNHRKIVVVDGRTAFVGGHNVGDEYLGKSPRFAHWRDTHLRLEGPVVQQVQAIYLQDWFWTARTLLEVEWKPQPCSHSNLWMMPLPTGPADPMEACSPSFAHLIHSAKTRLWISSPYFVPDETVTTALMLAARKGVDVRVMIPSKPDHLLVWLAAFSYIDEMRAAGVKLLRYRGGFLHQKAMLVDDRLSLIGTANIDNRSFRLNFEIGMFVSDVSFATQMEAMFEKDFAQCIAVEIEEYEGRALPFRLAVHVARLLAPIL